jgi:AraC-like DNA-binding protein
MLPLYWRPPEDPATSLNALSVRIFIVQLDELGPEHWNHPSLDDTVWRLYRNDRPGGTLTAAGVPCRLTPGAVYLVPSGLPLSSRSDGRFDQFFIHFSIDDVPPAALRELFPTPLQVPGSPAVQALTQECIQILRTPGSPAGTLRALALGAVYAALGTCLAAVPAEKYEKFRVRISAMRPVLPALDHIQNNISRPVTNAELAKLCHLSEDYFIQVFRESVGQTPARYLARRRIAAAAQLLLGTELSIDQIAAESGFRDRFYFSRAFTREMAVPPATFRKRPRV